VIAECVRKNGNEKVLNGRKGKENRLVDSKRVLTGKAEGLNSEKEQETLNKDGKQSVKKSRLLKVVRKVIGRGVHW
jgi:hypothetical protein